MLQDLSSKSAVKPKPSTRTLSFRSRCSANQSHKTCHATYGALQNKYTAYTSGFVSTASYVLAPKRNAARCSALLRRAVRIQDKPLLATQDTYKVVNVEYPPQ